MSIELLSLLTPGSPTLELTPRATDGSTVSPSDIAAAMALMPLFLSALLLQVYLHDASHREFLMKEATQRIKWRHSEMFHGKQWSRKLGRLVEMSLVDLEYPVQCSQCLGRGTVYTLEGAHECGDCRNGRIRPTIERLAKRAGVTRQAWYKSWDHRHKAVSHELSGWLAEAETSFGRAVRNA